MRNKRLLLITLFIVCMLCILSACTFSLTLPLATPVVTIGGNGVASWQAIENASGYKYKINGGEEIKTDELSVQLTSGQSIVVKACGDGVVYKDSGYSEIKMYVDPDDPNGCPHLDNNNDGICDLCNENVLTLLSLLSINDLHGKFMDTSTQPGLDEMTTYLKNLYADPAREEILISAGDMWQGTAESSMTKGKLMTTWMNEVGFASMTLGNHEFDWGVTSIQEAAELAEFPILGINVTVNGSRPNYIKASVVVEKGGVKIGIIGAIGNCLSSIASDMRRGVSFATGSALTNLVKIESTRLRNQEGCDIIVYVLHDGYGQTFNNVQNVAASDITYYDTSLSEGYVDVVFEGHAHQNYILRDEHGVYHLQGSSENKNISLVDISYNTVTKEIVALTPNKIPVSTYAASNINDDPVVQEIYDQFFPDTDLYAIIGTNNANRNSAVIKSKVAELYYKFGRDTWGSQYNVVLGGGFLSVRNPYNLYSGNVSYADIFTLLPFDNQLVLGSISGYNLKSRFINNTDERYACYYEISESSISDTATYYVVVDTYSSTFSDNGITEIQRFPAGTYARDLVADFVKSGGWGTGAPTGGGTTGGGSSSGNTTISIAEALAIGDNLDVGATASGTYTITGTITKFVGTNGTVYGNFYISDGTKSIYIFGLKSADGSTRYDAMDNPPQVGDTVTISGQIYKYESPTGSIIIEITNGRLQ